MPAKDEGNDTECVCVHISWALFGWYDTSVGIATL